MDTALAFFFVTLGFLIFCTAAWGALFRWRR